MRYTKTLLMAALVVAGVFLTSQAFAQWSDGGPEMFPLTYPPKTVTTHHVNVAEPPEAVNTAKALEVWSDGGPEMYALTYPPKTTPIESNMRMAAVQSNPVETPTVVALLWSDGGPEMYEEGYSTERATMTKGFRAKELIGETVRNADKRTLGSVDDLLVADNGRIKYVLLDGGGFLGRDLLGRPIGNELYAVPWTAFEANPKDKMLTLDVTRDKLQMAPAFKRDELAKLSNSAIEDRVYGYYGVKESMGQRAMAMMGNEQNTYRADAFIGGKVLDVNGFEIGRAFDFVADDNGRVDYVIVRHGGTPLLHLGSALTPVPWEAATLNPFDNSITINVNRDRFMAAPEIRENNWSGFDNDAWTAKINEYFE